MKAPKKAKRTLQSKKYKIPRNPNNVARMKLGSPKNVKIKGIQKLKSRFYA